MGNSEKENLPEDVSGQPDEIAFDESSGISKEDQDEILTTIELVVQENKIKVSPEIFRLHPQKKGVLFPTLVNVFAIVVLAAGISVLFLLFKRGEARLAEEVGSLTTAEGMLIRELKRESEEKLVEKNKEISKIQERLQRLDQERQELASNIESRIQEREEELREALSAELEEERARLKRQGVSEEDIKARLEALENQKATEYTQRLDDFKQEAEAEREKIEQNLWALQEEYNRNLEEANQERLEMVAESKQREEDLRVQLEEKERQLRAETSVARSELTQAQAALRRIEQQREKQDLVDTQIIGFYNTVKQNLQQGAFEKALQNLESIRSYLNEESIITLPSVQKRRAVEMFVIDSLSRLTESEMNKADEDIDMASLIVAAETVAGIRQSYKRAEELVQAGDIARAEDIYRDLLRRIPEINKSYGYLAGKQGQADQAGKDVLEDYLGRAAVAFSEDRYSDSLELYTRALGYLPEDTQAVQQIIEQVKESGYQMGSRQSSRDESANAASLLRDANALLRGGRYDRAIESYLDLIARYPQSRQVADATEGVKRAVDGQNQRSRDNLASAESSLDANIADRIAEIEELKDLQTGRDQQIGELEQALSRLQDTLSREKAVRDGRIAELETSLSQTKADLSRRETTLSSREADLRGKETELAGKDTLLARKDTLLAGKDTLLAQKDAELERRDVERREVEARAQREMAEVEEKIRLLEQSIEDKQSQLAATSSRLSEVSDELSGVNSRLDGVSGELSARTGELSATTEKLVGTTGELSATTEKLVGTTDELAAVSKHRDDLLDDIFILDDEMKDLQAELEAYKKIEGLQEIAASFSSESSTAEVEQLAALAEKFLDIQMKYAQYAAKEDQLLSEAGDQGLFETRYYLDEFLNQRNMASSFPGLWDRVKRYDQAFKTVGRDDAIQDVTYMVYDLAEMGSRENRLSFLDEEIARSEDNPIRIDLLEELKMLVGQ